MHHHRSNIRRPVEAFSERVGTALVNGSWFLRVLKPYAARIVVMHGHRHIDWIGACGRLKIISAPSPVMAGRRRADALLRPSLAAARTARYSLLEPERVDL